MAHVKSDLLYTGCSDLEQPGVEIMWLDIKFNRRNRVLLL